MALIRVPTIHTAQEFVNVLIKENCNNIDDLSKIYLSVKKLLNSTEKEKTIPTLQQLLVQNKI
jgi:N-glycosylase/DNA lyase